MRRHFFWVMLVLIGTAALTSFHYRAYGSESRAAVPSAPVAILRTEQGDLQPLTLEPIEKPDQPLLTNALPATNTCDLAPNLGVQEGGQTLNIRDFNNFVDVSDPELSCMWGNPASTRGFRTAWYKLEPEAYGLVSLSTRTSNYDTVLAVHGGTCGALIELACNDDDDYFSSRIELQVRAGETYYVEVADWHSAASGQMTLNIQSEPKPIDSQWEVVSTSSESIANRSRHAVVASGTKLYVIAGQTNVANSDRTPSVYVYDTATGMVQSRANMIGGSDQLGYSNTTAALINGRIYMPAGYTGINEGEHWVYIIADDWWYTDIVADNNWAGGQPAIYSEATTYSYAGPPGTGYFLSGGLTGTFPANDNSTNWAPRPELYFYSVDFNSWYTLNPMPTGRFGHVAARVSISGQSHLCVAGGMSGTPGTNREVLAGTICFNINTGVWSEFAPLNQERYFASSAVGADGNWYVFGGYDSQDNLVGVTERYDPVADEWKVLAPAYSVVPTRAWSRGAFVGNTLWIIGGETTNQGVLNSVQNVFLFRGSLFNYLPVVGTSGSASQENDTFATASDLSFQASILDRFYTAIDSVNIYAFDVPSPRQPVWIRLDQNNSSSQLDLALYTANKGLVAVNGQPGTVKSLNLDLNPGRYYLAVERINPPVGIEPLSVKYLLQINPG